MNPLPFQDLEPKRFEDLVRSLLYDFRDWVKIEATGRGGSDDGFDARGWEADPAAKTGETAGDDSEESVDFLLASRRWLIQCKRERVISPKKLLSYLNAIPEAEREELDGIVFAAACDFSKKTRDVFHTWCRQTGISEYHLWGKAELEDFLLQSKNDGLLFAFFGISLLVRRRSQRAELRSLLATKRKIVKIVGRVGDNAHKAVLIRDPADDRYPKAPADVQILEPGKGLNWGWIVRHIVSVKHDGILIHIRSALAYLADDGVSWDCIPCIGDEAIPRGSDNRWEYEGVRQVSEERKYGARKLWNEIPVANQAWYSSYGFIPYEAIIAIDEDGDDNSRAPTLFVNFIKGGPFSYGWGYIVAGDREAPNDPAKRISYFPKEIPEIDLPTLRDQNRGAE